jgi:multimeric flavodoxin WrbA
MKIVALMSSYRKGGNTARMVELIGKAVMELAVQKGEPLDFQMVYLGHQRIEMCRGCRVCFNQGEVKCPLQDDVLRIKAKILAADAVILASPVYVEDVNGIMKNWIDRMAHVCHRPEFAGKYAYALTTSGLGSTNHALRTLNTALRTWGFYIVGQAGLRTGAYMRQADLEQNFEHQAHEIAGQIFAAIHAQKASRPSFLSMMTFKIQQAYWKKPPQDPNDAYDYDYWQRRGWTDSRREFYIWHKSSRVKTALARITGTILARFVV